MVEIYYVEDDPNIANMVKEYLEQKNFRVTVCITLTQARQSLLNHVPTLVLLDWNMPDGHGDTLCQWIRSKWKELPIIFLAEVPLVPIAVFMLFIMGTVVLAYYLGWRNVRKINLAEVLRDDTLI